ncbi:DUF1993 domain-containing protein [Mesorhizobium sp. SP-1A]|uniref:DUF1993 domain-containing protein n=1 Tax=Mesorhizobium sp. SP-1A TaxID=3077840 RepID=UPI0028F72A5A|nr:DUF1993 domain-containing protein [Mesorhizobium sp. SP-1A]
MPLSLYEITVPVFIRGLRNLSHNLKKGEAFADEKGIPHEELTSARLYPDMLPLTAQIQRASDSSRFVAVRVGQVEPRPMADEEKTFAELQARITATIDYLKTVPANCMDGREDAHVSFKAGPRTLEFNGTSYVLGFAIPNFYFHVTTAYDILRHKGVPVGKVDFLAGADGS